MNICMFIFSGEREEKLYTKDNLAVQDFDKNIEDSDNVRMETIFCR